MSSNQTFEGPTAIAPGLSDLVAPNVVKPQEKEAHLEVPKVVEEKTPLPSPPVVREDEFLVIRNGLYLAMPRSVLASHGYHLDGDVFQTNGRSAALVNNNKYRFVGEDSFLKGVDEETVGNRSMDDSVLDRINAWLIANGKIPEYLSLRMKDDQTVGVFTSKTISPKTYLGTVEGARRPKSGLTAGRPHTYPLVGFDGQEIGVIDCDNMLFSNWTRFIARVGGGNCSVSGYNMSAMIFSEKTIQADKELFI